MAKIGDRIVNQYIDINNLKIKEADKWELNYKDVFLDVNSNP